MLNFLPSQRAIISQLSLLEGAIILGFLVVHAFVVTYLIYIYQSYIFALISLAFGSIIAYFSLKADPIALTGGITAFSMMANICVLLVLQASCPPIGIYLVFAGFIFMILSAVMEDPADGETHYKAFFHLLYLQGFMFAIIIFAAAMVRQWKKNNSPVPLNREAIILASENLK